MEAARIARALRIPPDAVSRSWPLIEAALVASGQGSRLSLIGAAATVHVETAAEWLPIHEFGGHAYFLKYETGQLAITLGNNRPGDGYLFRGRGFVQLTGRTNYTKVDARLGLGGRLVADPELACDPSVAARILADFWRAKKIADQCNAQAWERVRKLVNGGLNGWPIFVRAVSDLKSEFPADSAPPQGGQDETMVQI